MKIGILTHHYVNNFGAFLQAYALQKAVERIYPDDEVYIINYINRRQLVINSLGWCRFYIGQESLSDWPKKITLPFIFAKERKKHLNLTKAVYTAEEVNSMNFDTIIIGSDEVWNYADTKSADPIKFAQGLDCKNIISYAPSAAQAPKKMEMPQYAKDGLAKFGHISTRDDLTEKLVEKCGYKSIRVLDPTFLSEIPNGVAKPKKKPYILFYYCDGIPEAALVEIKRFAKENNYDLYGAGEAGKIYTECTVNITPFEWVDMFKNASYVVTGTFHGAVFSILNKKQFACYMTNPSRIQKVGSLLSEFGLEDRRFTNQDVIDVLKKQIDYNSCYDIINSKRAKSIEYLKNSIILKEYEGKYDAEEI